jgi:serine/threonine protein kinase
MGEVYRARDSRLNRDVALKILPAAFATDPGRLARFRREALASLDHPNVAAIFAFEESGDVQALVLELVEGPTLADRLALGAVSLDRALPIARQIAEAVEAAHQQGIIHRDLKPANIKLRPDGTVKVLDFGLAKALDPLGSPDADSPTLTVEATEAGVILGTAAYMSPEQASGTPIDKRSDVWAFGCLLYEILTGTRAFAGQTAADVLVAVLEREPAWALLPRSTPVKIRDLLHRCLRKNRDQRLHDMADARIEIDEALHEPSPEPRANQRKRGLEAIS